MLHNFRAHVLNKVLVLRKRALGLSYFAQVREHTAPGFFLKGNLLLLKFDVMRKLLI